MKNDYQENRWCSRFIELPLYLQIVVVSMVGVFLFWLFNVQLFNHQNRKISANKNTIDALMWKINKQTNFISSTQYGRNDPNFDQFVNRVNVLNPANFIKQISSLAKKTHIEIQAIKPAESEFENSKTADITTRSLKIEVVGKYNNILDFLIAIPKFSTLVTIGNFQRTALLATKDDELLHDKYLLALNVTLNLYGYAS